MTRRPPVDWLTWASRVVFVPSWLLFGAIAFSGSVAAATFHVDDSTTFPNDATTAMKWRSLSPSRAGGNVVEGTSVVTVRLNLAPWLNKNGRIYMALSEQSIGQVKAAWATQGRLLPGELISGHRTLVYAGPIRTGLLEDTIALKLETDGRRLLAPQRLQFYFEIDVD